MEGNQFWAVDFKTIILTSGAMEVASPSLTFTHKLAITLVSAVVHHAMYLGSGIFSKKLFERFGFTYADQQSWRSRYGQLFDM